jgi:hypothetical protein
LEKDGIVYVKAPPEKKLQRGVAAEPLCTTCLVQVND